MIKTLNNTIKQDRTAYKIPRSVQDVIPIQRIFADGIFQFGTKYSRTLRFSDINYAIASKEDKTAMFLGYSELLNALDSGSTTKLTICNKQVGRQAFEDIDHHVLPRLGDIPLNKLTSLDIQQFYKDLLESGRMREDTKAKKPGLSSTTVHGIHVMLKSALKRAVQERLIPFNPAEFCIPPKVTKPELQVIPSERYQSYLTAAEQRGVLPMFYLELATGLRKGEIAALLWSDFDAQTKTIHVTKQYLFYNGQGTVSPPKSDSSTRYVSISDEAARLLQQEHEKHPNNPYMFPSPVTGEMYHPDAIVKIHRKICKDIGLENVRFHDLRHSFATTALQCGVDVKTVSTMPGHSSAGFTLNVYTHSTSRMQQEAARTVGKVMPKMLER